MYGMGGMPDGAMRGMGGSQSDPMGSGIKRGRKGNFRKAFTLSGSFSDATLDGWSTGGVAFTSSNARTAPGCMSMTGNLLNQTTFTVPAQMAKNYRFTFSVWHRHRTGGTDTSRALRYRLGAEANDAQLVLVNNSTSVWAQMSGVIDNVEDREIVFVLFGSCNTGSFEVLFDDWSIEGTPLENVPA